jgi:hypothetical protein
MSNRVKTGIVAALRADSTLTGLLTSGTAGIHHSVAPQGSSFPCVTFQKVPGTQPAYTLGARAWENELYNIKAVTEGHSALTAGSIAERIDTVLTDNPVSVSGGTCLYLRLESYIEYPEVTDGKTYQHIGGSYRVWST